MKNKILQLRSSYEYEISKFKHFQELLKERENIDISYSALYKILKNAGVFSINNSKFQILDKSLPPKIKIKS